MGHVDIIHTVHIAVSNYGNVENDRHTRLTLCRYRVCVNTDLCKFFSDKMEKDKAQNGGL